MDPEHAEYLRKLPPAAPEVEQALRNAYYRTARMAAADALIELLEQVGVPQQKAFCQAWRTVDEITKLPKE